MPNFDPLGRKCELAFISFLTAPAQKDSAALASIRGWFPLSGNDIKTYPRGIAETKSCTERPRMAGRGVYDVDFSLHIVSNADDDTAQVHEARIGAVIAQLNNTRAVKLALNAPLNGQPDTRTVRDFNLYGIFLHKFDSSRVDNKWVGEVELRLIAQGMDVVPG